MCHWNLLTEQTMQVWIRRCKNCTGPAEFELYDFRLIEADAKSLNSLSGSGHSRKSSDTSQISLTSGKELSVNRLKLHWIQPPNMAFIVASIMLPGTSSTQERNEDGEEDIWTLWGRVSNDWDNFWKKRNSFVRVSCSRKWCDTWLKSLLRLESSVTWQ
jgi:hypothetical protein